MQQKITHLPLAGRSKRRSAIARRRFGWGEHLRSGIPSRVEYRDDGSPRLGRWLHRALARRGIFSRCADGRCARCRPRIRRLHGGAASPEQFPRHIRRRRLQRRLPAALCRRGGQGGQRQLLARSALCQRRLRLAVRGPARAARARARLHARNHRRPRAWLLRQSRSTGACGRADAHHVPLSLLHRDRVAALLDAECGGQVPRCCGRAHSAQSLDDRGLEPRAILSPAPCMRSPMVC